MVFSARTLIERDLDDETIRQMKASSGRDMSVGGPRRELGAAEPAQKGHDNTVQAVRPPFRPASLLLICAGARASSDTASKAFPRTPNIVLVAF
jgi:hypothetical protein